MSRDRPTELPRAVPDKVMSRHELRETRRRAELDQLKSFSGPAFMGYLAQVFTRGNLKRAPAFIRRGYEADIVERLGEFFRDRPWRQRHRRSGATHKERLKMQRAAAQRTHRERAAGSAARPHTEEGGHTVRSPSA